MNKPFLQLVAEDIQTRFGDQLSDVAIVFNNKRPITYLKKHLSDVFGKAIWSPQFFTIQEFIKLSSGKTESSQLTQFFYLYELHNAMLIEEGIEPETLEEFYPIAEIILSDFSQLDYELVNVDHIFMELHDSTKIDLAFQQFTPEQQAFIRQFWQSFSINGHTAVQQRFLRLWKRLPKLYLKFKQKLHSEKQSNYPTLYRNLVEGKADNPNFIQKYKKVLFIGFNALNKAEAHLFKKWQAEEKALFYFDADAYYLDDKQQEAGLFIRRNIQSHNLHNALGESPNIIGSRSNNIHLYAADGKNSQTKLLHQILLQEEKENQSSAILLADESLLVPLLQSLPDLKPNITTGYPLMQSPIYGLLDLWMKVQEDIAHLRRNKIPFQYVETFANHPLSRLADKERSELLNNITAKQLFEVDLESIHIKTSVLPYFFRPISNSQDLLPSLIHILDTLQNAMAEQDRVGQIDSNLLVETKKVLNQLQLGINSLAPTSIAFQIGLVKKAITPINSAIEGDPLKGLQIMGLLESRCLNFDTVYILGANEGILPPTSSSPTFLPNSLRMAYDLPILENQDALSAYLFYRNFQYSKGIHVFYNSLIDENSSGEESRFIKQLQFESNFNFITHRQQQPIQFGEPAKELVIPKQGAVWTTLFDNYVAKKKKLSATALTSYLQSPLQFFLKYVAEIKEPPTLSQEFEMNKLGTVIHEVMEKVLQPYKGVESFTSTNELKKKLTIIDQLVIQEIAVLYHVKLEKLDDLNSMQRIMHKIAYEYVCMYLQYDIDHYQAFKIIELENDKDYNLDFPITIQGKEETIRLFGIIDRVDEVLTADGEVKTRIVDYKTGGDSVVFKSLDKVFASDTDNKALVQTLFYAYVFEKCSNITQLEPHLYVARKMREEGSIFKTTREILEGPTLAKAKEEFVVFLKQILEELFNPDIPFKHNPENKIYESDPYKLFYKYAATELEDEHTVVDN